MDPSAVVARTQGLMSAPVDDDLVILNPARDDYVALDEVGRRIWELLEQPQTVGELCEALGAQFDGDAQQILGDVTTFLDELRDERLIDVVDKAPR
jgi:Coenzyme PQQ synthesis protein D (PqqD)